MDPSPYHFLFRRTEVTEDGCWLWTGYRSPAGYGQAGYEGKVWLAHRLAWTLTNGPIPAGLQVCHACDRPPCINPAHLWLGTNADNSADKAAKGRARRPVLTHCPAGHEYTPENTVAWASGRRCRTCRTAAAKARKQRRAAIARDFMRDSFPTSSGK